MSRRFAAGLSSKTLPVILRITQSKAPVLILQVVSQEAMHGYRIAQEIKRLSRDVLEFKEGGLYPTLHSLEADGYLESYKQIAKGRTRRYYQITEKGTTALAKRTPGMAAFIQCRDTHPRRRAMLGFHAKQPYTFDAWLNAATRGLCDHARERIREELKDHYLDAYDALIEDGITGAEARAVSELGSPKKARRRFKKIYLTIMQSDTLSYVLNSTHRSYVLLFGRFVRSNHLQILIFCFVAAIMSTILAIYDASRSFKVFYGLPIALVMIALSLAYFFIRLRRKKSTLLARIMHHAINNLFSPVILLFYVIPYLFSTYDYLLELLGYYLIFCVLQASRISLSDLSLAYKLKFYPAHNMTPTVRKIMALTGERLDIDSDKPREQ